MKQYLIFLLFSFFSVQMNAQYSLRLIVTDVATKKLDDIYIAGSFNNWNPADPNYKLKPFGAGRKAIVLKDLPASKYEFKFTRGSWDKVETTAKGEDIPNRVIDLTDDASLDIAIPGWKDNFPDKPKPNTASPNVQLMDSAFYMPQLKRNRRIWVYLPADYKKSANKKYPVLYLQDGQNLFNEQTAAFGEWGIDECLDSLQKQTGKSCIVIGIDNGGEKRLTEYNPYDNEKYGKGEGSQYLDFIVNTLKPFVDSKYRTLKDAPHTFIGGSSMGALISLYGLIQYPKTFGAAGIFSPSFSIAPQIYRDVEKTVWPDFLRFYFYAGGKESATMVSDVKKMYDLIAQKHNYDMEEKIYPPGQHNEQEWRKEFAGFYTWLMKNQ